MPIFTPSGKKLDLSQRDELNSDAGIAALVEILQQSDTLEELILGDRITDKIAHAIAPALKNNTGLRRLTFDITTRNWTDFSADGMDALNDMLSSGHNITLSEVNISDGREGTPALSLNRTATAAVTYNTHLRELVTSANAALQASSGTPIGEKVRALTAAIDSLTQELKTLERKQADALSSHQTQLDTLGVILNTHNTHLFDREQNKFQARLATIPEETERLCNAYDNIKGQLQVMLAKCIKQQAELAPTRTLHPRSTSRSTTSSWCGFWEGVSEAVAAMTPDYLTQHPPFY